MRHVNAHTHAHTPQNTRLHKHTDHRTLCVVRVCACAVHVVCCGASGEMCVLWHCVCGCVFVFMCSVVCGCARLRFEVVCAWLFCGCVHVLWNMSRSSLEKEYIGCHVTIAFTSVSVHVSCLSEPIDAFQVTFRVSVFTEFYFNCFSWLWIVCLLVCMFWFHDCEFRLSVFQFCHLRNAQHHETRFNQHKTHLRNHNHIQEQKKHLWSCRTTHTHTTRTTTKTRWGTCRQTQHMSTQTTRSPTVEHSLHSRCKALNTIFVTHMTRTEKRAVRNVKHEFFMTHKGRVHGRDRRVWTRWLDHVSRGSKVTLRRIQQHPRDVGEKHGQTLCFQTVAWRRQKGPTHSFEKVINHSSTRTRRCTRIKQSQLRNTPEPFPWLQLCHSY